jgi:hypothetical protein
MRRLPMLLVSLLQMLLHGWNVPAHPMGSQPGGSTCREFTLEPSPFGHPKDRIPLLGIPTQLQIYLVHSAYSMRHATFSACILWAADTYHYDKTTGGKCTVNDRNWR